jgi:2-dehydro-3-deoxygalactonokinase
MRAAAHQTPAPAGDEFVAVDWGSTHLRLRLLPGVSGRPIAEVESAEGIAAVPAGRHREVFLAGLERLLRGAGRWERWSGAGGEVYFAGMITSTLGWIPTPYIEVPAGAREILAGRKTERIGKLALHFLPGLRTADDVLRGEEVEAIGILPGEDGGAPSPVIQLVLPGTHSKWIRFRAGRIEHFITVPTGDLHAGLHRATFLARTLPAVPAAVAGPLLEHFDRGIDLARRDGPLAALFKGRSLAVLDGLAPEAASALLSGILIGGEALERLRSSSDAPVLVAGSVALRDLYLRALSRLGFPAEGVPEELSARASAEGLRKLRALARNPSGDQCGPPSRATKPAESK